MDEFIIDRFAREVHIVGPLDEFGATACGKDVVGDELVVIGVHFEAHAADAFHHVIVDEAVARACIKVEAVAVLIEGKRTVARAFCKADAVGDPVAGDGGEVVALLVARVKCRAVLGLEHVVVDAIIGNFVHAACVENAPMREVVEEVMADVEAPTFHEDGGRAVSLIGDVADEAIFNEGVVGT